MNEPEAVLPVLVVNLENVELDGGVTYVHDMALDGDEDLHLGKHVLVDGGIGRLIDALVVDRNDATGYWYLQLDT